MAVWLCMCVHALPPSPASPTPCHEMISPPSCRPKCRVTTTECGGARLVFEWQRKQRQVAVVGWCSLCLPSRTVTLCTAAEEASGVAVEWWEMGEGVTNQFLKLIERHSSHGVPPAPPTPSVSPIPSLSVSQHYTNPLHLSLPVCL